MQHAMFQPHAEERTCNPVQRPDFCGRATKGTPKDYKSRDPEGSIRKDTINFTCCRAGAGRGCLSFSSRGGCWAGSRQHQPSNRRARKKRQPRAAVAGLVLPHSRLFVSCGGRTGSARLFTSTGLLPGWCCRARGSRARASARLVLPV